MEFTKVAEVVRLHGVGRAREMAATATERRLVDIAAQVMADEEQAIGIAYSGLCLTGLPYRRLPDDEIWTKRGHQVTLVIQPGVLVLRGTPVRYGVPWGSRGRILLIHLMSEASRTDSREVVLGRSARDALERMGLSYGGESAKSIQDQIARLSACNLRWAWDQDGADANHRGALISSSLTLRDEDDRRVGVLSDVVRLDLDFFTALRKHPVPLAEEAIKRLSHSPMALDVYAFLAYRLHSLERPVEVSWPSLAAQFGPSHKELWRFRSEFLPCLGAACAAYPDARVDLTDHGLRLNPSRPPVAKRTSPARRLARGG